MPPRRRRTPAATPVDPNTELVADADEIQLHTLEFVLMARRWREYPNPPSGPLVWKDVAFEEDAAPEIPTSKGVYGFVIHSGVAPQLANYLLYVGKAEKGLRTRFREYFDELVSPTGRPAVVYHFRRWKEHLRFWYATPPPSEIVDAEEQLIKALKPPVNKALPATIRRAHAAFPN